MWSNALAGAVLAAGLPTASWPILAAAFALTLFYIGGMWLNDAFDAEIDRAERKERPIPAGEIGRGTVFAIGWALLAGGVAVGFLLGPSAGLAAAGLALAVTLYDWLHKKTPLSPLIMGTTRLLSYVLAALAVGHLPVVVLAAGAGLFAYVVGLTYAARREASNDLGGIWPLAALAIPLVFAAALAGGDPLALALCGALLLTVVAAIWRLVRRGPGDVPRAVVTLIAGIALYDAALIAAAGLPILAFIAAMGFALTLTLQRLAPGT